jgi:hypothetical protein
VLRGGSWNNKSRNLRSANRNNNNPANTNNNVGFRCAQQSFHLSTFLDRKGCSAGMPSAFPPWYGGQWAAGAKERKHCSLSPWSGVTSAKESRFRPGR